MNDLKISTQKILRIEKKKNLNINIINRLDIDINCDIELLGDKLTIWIRRENSNVP